MRLPRMAGLGLDVTDPTDTTSDSSAGTPVGTTGGPCPGSPGCPGYVAPGSTDYQNSVLQEILSVLSGGQQQTAGTAPAADNTQKYLIYGALGLAAFALLMGMTRR